MSRNYSSRLARALSTIREGRARAVEEMFTKNQTHLEVPSIPNNPSEGVIFGSNKFKEQHETMKL